MEQLDEQSKLRKYILNDISDQERSAIEERLLMDDEYFEEVSMAEENLIQDYADGNLDAKDRERFEKYFLSSEENRQKVKFSRALRKYVNETERSPQTEKKPGFFNFLKVFFSAPVPVAFAVLAIAGIVGFFIWKNYSNNSEILIALKNSRPTAGRITGFDYAPKTEGTRGTNKDENLDLALVKARAIEAVRKNETAETLHNFGLVYLAENNFDEAIKQFEKALKKNSDSAKIHNDLGVAFIEKGKQKTEGSFELFTRANDEIEKAIALDKNLTEAYFNRALVIELLNLPNPAKEAWENYLKLDSSSKWADEAREHLQKLETNKPITKTKEEILQKFLEAQAANDKEKAWQTLSRNKEIITGKLIPQQLAFLFIDSKINGNEPKAKEALNALIFAGKLEEEKSGDLFWRDLAKYYSNVPTNKISILKQAQKAYLEGIEICKKAEYEKAIEKFESAQNLYNQAANELEPKVIDFLIGYCKNRNTKIEESTETLSELSDYCKKKDYRWLNIQADTWLATNELSLKRFSDSLEKLTKAIAVAKKVDDVFSQQKILSLFTETYSLIGQNKNVFESIQENLTLGKMPDASPRVKWRALNTMTRFFYRIKNFHSANLFEQEALMLAQQLGDITFEYTSLVDLGLISSGLGKPDLALELIEKGQKISETFSDSKYKEKCFARTNLLLGHIKRQTQDYSGAAEKYQQAVNFYDSGNVQVYSYDAHRGLLLSYSAEKNDDAFKMELPKILKIFDTYRTEILEEQNRNSFFDNEQDVYDIAIDFEFRNRNYTDAFNYSEQSRSRSLLDMQNSIISVSTDEKQPQIKFSPNVTEPSNLPQIQAEMPETVQLLQYSVLKDKTLIWLITKDNLTAEKVEISSESLKEKVLTYFDLVSKTGEINEQRNLSAELFKILINPIKEKLDINKEVFIIPDKVLFKLPFDTLFSEKYLIEDYRISYAPSANVFLFSSKKAAEFGAKPAETLLSIGNPTFNQATYENTLQPLPSAKKEADEIAKFYASPTVFTENNATKEIVKENLKKADVVHFAGHYVVNEHTPLLSALVLAGNEKKNSSLANYEIIGESLSNTRLIVLSACQTGIEKYYNGEGMIGASRTFLATGVPLVVTSQWSVDSEASKELMVRFHRFRKTEQISTAEALRRAQIEMLRSEKYQQPYYWAAFAAIGGYTKF